ncbi:hypothetical protein JTT01_03285 [Clostridium botulinum]|nr:hypothetical protein [Clostridium botulinum]
MSESKLRQSFKNHYGIPLYRYIRIETMKRAMQLLSADHLSIRNISELCGYKIQPNLLLPLKISMELLLVILENLLIYRVCRTKKLVR